MNVTCDSWKRLVDDKIIQVTINEKNKPGSVTHQNHKNGWQEKYEGTQAHVKLINKVVDLNGIFCPNNLW